MSPVKKSGEGSGLPPGGNNTSDASSSVKSKKKARADKKAAGREADSETKASSAPAPDIAVPSGPQPESPQDAQQATGAVPPPPDLTRPLATNAVLPGSMLTSEDLVPGGSAGVQGTMISAYQYLRPNQRFRWGPERSDYLVPMALYVPRTPHEPPPPIGAFKDALPIAPKPLETDTELDYNPKVALAVHQHPIGDERYAVPKPDPKDGYTAPPLLGLESLVTEEGKRTSIGPFGTIKRDGNVFAAFHPSMQPWLGETVKLNSLDILQINPNVIEAMPPLGRDRLLDALEDHGSHEITKFIVDSQEEAGELGPAATLALLMRSQGSEKGFAALVGARPIPVITELLTMSKAPFKPENIPWIVYYSLPRLRMARHLEQGFTAAAVAGSVCSLLEQAYGKASGPNEVDNANKLIKAYRNSKAWLDVLPSLEKTHPEISNFYFGTMYGLLLSGSMLYAFKVLRRDDHRRFWVKWGIKSIVTIALTAPTAHAAPFVAPIIVTVADKFLDGISDPLADKIIEKKDWIDSIHVFTTELKRTLFYESAKELRTDEAADFMTGFETTLSLLEDSREMYRKQFSGNPSLQLRIARHPYLQKFLDVVFDAGATATGPLMGLIRGRPSQ